MIEMNILQDERNILQAEKDDLHKRYLAECSISKHLKQSLTAALSSTQHLTTKKLEETVALGSTLHTHENPTQQSGFLSSPLGTLDDNDSSLLPESSLSFFPYHPPVDDSSLEVALRAALEDGKNTTFS